MIGFQYRLCSGEKFENRNQRGFYEETGQKIIVTEKTPACFVRVSLVLGAMMLCDGKLYDMLGEFPVKRELGTDDEALIEFVRKHSPLTVPKECSITTTQAEKCKMQSNLNLYSMELITPCRFGLSLLCF